MHSFYFQPLSTGLSEKTISYIWKQTQQPLQEQILIFLDLIMNSSKFSSAIEFMVIGVFDFGWLLQF